MHLLAKKSRTYLIDVRFSDLDVLGHVNNAVYLSYFEKIRIQWLLDEKIISPASFSKIPLILARSEVDYRHPISDFKNYPIAVWLCHLGTKSFQLEYIIYEKQTVFAQAKTIQVWFDYEKKSTQIIPDKIRKKLAILEEKNNI